MDLSELGDWAGAAVALVGITFVFYQVVIQRGQQRLQESDAHRQQASAWNQLSEHWETAALVATGPAAARWIGVPAAKIDGFLSAIDEFRLAKLRFLAFSEADAVEDTDYEDYETAVSKARQGLSPYERSVQRVVMHLAQVSGLVIRGRLSVDVAYDAFGIQLLRIRENLPVLLREGFANDSSCPAPMNAELHLWRKVGPELMASRVGWGDFLEVAQGTAERITVLFDLMVLHALESGDLGPVARIHGEPAPAELISHPDRLAVIWRVGRRRNAAFAFRLTRRFVRVGLYAKRAQAYWYPNWFSKLLYRVKWTRNVQLPRNGWLLAPYHFCAAPFIVFVSAWRSRNVPDVRRPETPWHYAERIGVDIS